MLAAIMAVPLSQLGHVLVYLVRYGPAVWSQESFGAHAYFPALAKTSAGLLGLVVLAAVAVAGLARLIDGRRSPGRARSSSAALFDLVAVLLPLQLAIFTAQEAAELVLAGRLNGLGDVPLLWGVAGQLPVACLAALFLRWASIAVDDAIERLHVWLDLVLVPPVQAALTSATPAPALGLAGADDGRMAGLERGPPQPAHAP